MLPFPGRVMTATGDPVVIVLLVITVVAAFVVVVVVIVVVVALVVVRWCEKEKGVSGEDLQ